MEERNCRDAVLRNRRIQCTPYNWNKQYIRGECRAYRLTVLGKAQYCTSITDHLQKLPSHWDRHKQYMWYCLYKPNSQEVKARNFCRCHQYLCSIQCRRHKNYLLAPNAGKSYNWCNLWLKSRSHNSRQVKCTDCTRQHTESNRPCIRNSCQRGRDRVRSHTAYTRLLMYTPGSSHQE